MKIFLMSLFTTLLFLISTCESGSEDMVKINGVIEKQEITSYQYGTHVLKGERDLFALRSSQIELDDYLGKTVRITAKRIKGYPVEGGPIFLEVKEIKAQ